MYDIVKLRSIAQKLTGLYCYSGSDAFWISRRSNDDIE